MARNRFQAAVLETPRLALREMTLGDLDFVAGMLGDPEGMRFYPKPLSREESEAWVRRQIDRYERDGHGLWLVVEKASGHPVGQVGLSIQEVEGVREPEIGYLIHRPSWRRGFAAEAALATRDHAFAVLGKPRVISLVRPENLPSRRVAMRIGMTIEKQVLFRGLDHRVFAVSRPAK
ncbi:MAG TPA: GNAT family N-acetyltransferase [Planctomycetota bacterium]|nr:GNAT family N-acetyltransferase [Planctomycetota bacterium]